MPDYSVYTRKTDFLISEVLPHLSNLCDGTISLETYLKHFEKDGKFYSLPFSYVYDLELIKKYKDKCVCFWFADADSISKGAPPVYGMHQFSPNLHIYNGISFWEEGGKFQSHVAPFFFYRTIEDVLNFVKENKELIKQEDSSQRAGFNFQNK